MILPTMHRRDCAGDAIELAGLVVLSHARERVLRIKNKTLNCVSGAWEAPSVPSDMPELSVDCWLCQNLHLVTV